MRKSFNNSQPIGVFDSGVGGLSILIELRRLLPEENFIFLADQKYVPYGEKTKKELVQRGLRITNYFVKNHNIKMMVIACNTATCGAINEIRNRYAFPIVGTVPAIKPAAETTKTGVIGVMSTPSTSKSEVVRNLIRDNCKGVKVFNVGCKNLEDTVEQGEMGNSEVDKLLKKYLREIKASKADRLVLGCTHYPFLKKVIAKMAGPNLKLIDSGKAIAKRTNALLVRNKFKNNQDKKGSLSFVTTGDPEKFRRVASKLLKIKVEAGQALIP
ncbi:MAG: glutamate racemase [Candidatus Pacebacteria bacterium]|nr:glutamate racemase [Candidatus Paceibacterota bacterium]